MLELLATIILAFGGIWAFLKLVWEPGRTEHLKAQAYIRDLEWRSKQLDAGLNPDGMPYDYDRSCDYHNVGCTCEQCKTVSAKNDKVLARDRVILNRLLGRDTTTEA